MEKSESIKNIANALLLFQVKMGKIKKDANNPFFKSKYATLSTILEHIQIPMSESGLSYTQFPNGENGLTTILMHPESGEFIQATYNIQPSYEYQKEKDGSGQIVWRSDKPHITPQGMGSAITYARRYALGAILGLNIDDDDDGNAASGKNTQNKQKNDYETALPWLNENTEAFIKVCEALKGGNYTIDQVEKKYRVSKPIKEKLSSLIPKK